jgi:hypothetical protein
MKRTERFLAGDVVALDRVYSILGLIPTEAYQQDDIADRTPCNGNDCGESVRFVRDVTIRYEIIMGKAKHGSDK